MFWLSAYHYKYINISCKLLFIVLSKQCISIMQFVYITSIIWYSWLILNGPYYYFTLKIEPIGLQHTFPTNTLWKNTIRLWIIMVGLYCKTLYINQVITGTISLHTVEFAEVNETVMGLPGLPRYCLISKSILMFFLLINITFLGDCDYYYDE